MKNYLRNWNFMRVLRLAMGIFIMIQGLLTNQWLITGLGGLFSLMSLMNMGFCGTSGCKTFSGKVIK